MYLPKHFDESRAEVLHELIRRHPFGALVANTTQGLDATHVPFEIDASAGPLGTLRCHIARANPIWRDFGATGQAMVLFQGPHGYVSPAWYPAKQEHGKVVPTWNYAIVHAHGTLRAIEDPVWLRGFVSRLTDRNEGARAVPWKVSDAPEEYLEKMLGAIVGLELTIERLQGKWKLSQNRSLADQQGVVAGLASEGDATAAAMLSLMHPKSPA
ncbi:MAG TPA: FMN-binding negative transcriptional regulator [Steroidobacteraceae bacterium]|jgi:transcriptional regulator